MLGVEVAGRREEEEKKRVVGVLAVEPVIRSW